MVRSTETSTFNFLKVKEMSDEFQSNLKIIQEIFPDYTKEFCEKWLNIYDGDVSRVCDYFAQSPACTSNEVESNNSTLRRIFEESPSTSVRRNGRISNFGVERTHGNSSSECDRREYRKPSVSSSTKPRYDGGFQGFQVRVIVDCESELNGELTLKVGDIINVLSTNVSEGWWKGRSNGAVGIFPSNFVEIIDEPSSLHGKSLNLEFTLKVSGSRVFVKIRPKHAENEMVSDFSQNRLHTKENIFPVFSRCL